VFFDPGQFEQLQKMQESTQKGFGSVVSLLPGRVIVLQTLPGTPSAKAGLAPGDEIVAVNGYAINRLDLEQITELLTESRQQQAQLEVRPSGSSGIKHLVLTPEEMQAPSVERTFFVGAGIGYIRVASFDEKTSGQLKLAILINEKTASASEIVSGATQGHDRATIIGQASYGKGLVQSVFPLTEATGLALTTALYYTPSGRSIQKPLDAARFELGAATAHPNTQKEFRTDKGRVVTGGGGIQPDMVVYPPATNRLRTVLDASGSFTNFATEYLRNNKVTGDFEVTPQIMDEFRVFLSERDIHPGIAEWSVEREFVLNRLKTEIFNQAFGVEKGDEVEAQRDPVILKALEVLGG